MGLTSFGHTGLLSAAVAIAHHEVTNIAALSGGAGVEVAWRKVKMAGSAPHAADARDGVYQFGDVTVDLDRFELRRAGLPQHVEPQVLEVLAYRLASQR
jgi:hypothetical protein